MVSEVNMLMTGEGQEGGKERCPFFWSLRAQDLHIPFERCCLVLVMELRLHC